MIPTQKENPKGLYLRYLISKADGTPVDENAEYFVLRIDLNGKDQKHIAACRKALMVYADEIKDHLPQLSRELIYNYSDRKCQSPIGGKCVRFCADCQDYV